jgi:hypothetical protein
MRSAMATSFDWPRASRRAPSADVRLHRGELDRRERSWLQQDRVWDADLADVVEWCGAAQQLHRLGIAVQLLGQQAGQQPHALGVPPGRVVAELRCPRQAVEDVAAGRLQLLRSLADQRLEAVVVVAQLPVQPARSQQVLDPQPDLVGLERLGDEVLGAPRERLLLRLRRDVGGEHQDGEEVVGRGLGAQRRDHLQSGDARHVQVGADQVEGRRAGEGLAVALERLLRLGAGSDVSVAGGAQDAPQQHRVDPLVVDDEDPGRGEIVLHGSLRRAASFRPPETCDRASIAEPPTMAGGGLHSRSEGTAAHAPPRFEVAHDGRGEGVARLEGGWRASGGIRSAVPGC